MVACADTSFLFSLYGNDANSPLALAWARGNNQPVTISLLNEFELGNALSCAVFRKAIQTEHSNYYWSLFEADQSSGKLCRQTSNLAEVLQVAKRLSLAHSESGGHRGFDILHVASALHWGAALFLSFDANQNKLAKAEGLDVLK